MGSLRRLVWSWLVAVAVSLDTRTKANTDVIEQASKYLSEALAQSIHTSLVTADVFETGWIGYNATGATTHEDLRRLLYTHIRVVDSSVYHLWSGHPDGGFIGYYNVGVLADGVTYGFMADATWSCADAYGIAAPCREYFETTSGGAPAASFNGASYDCRTRAWSCRRRPRERERRRFGPRRNTG